MAAEEGFVLSCASKPAVCAIAFDLSDDGIAMEFPLGEAHDDSDELELARLLASALCDEFAIDEEAATIRLVKRAS